MKFERDKEKSQINQEKHGVGFDVAQLAFPGKQRIILQEKLHSDQEERFYCSVTKMNKFKNAS